MFNIRSSVIIAGIAFIFSFFIGFISRSTLPMLVIRPLVFAAVFFIISVFIKILVDRFLPELLEDSAPLNNSFQLGSKINIIDETPENFQASEPAASSGRTEYASQGQSVLGARPDDGEEELGDISDLSSINTSSDRRSKGMDQNNDDDYNGKVDFNAFPEPALDKFFVQDEPTQASPAVSENLPSLDSFLPKDGSQKKKPDKGVRGVQKVEETLPDLDSMSGAFIPVSLDVDPDEESYSTPDRHAQIPSAKAPEWTEDFTGRDMAQGIQTILKKDKES